VVQGTFSQIILYSTNPSLVLDRTKAQGLKTPDGMYTDPSAPQPTPDFDPDPRGNNSCTVRDVR
jgi:hypothetical protein